MLSQSFSDAHRFAYGSRLSWGPRGPDQGAVVDGAALGALGPDGGGVLGDLGRHHALTELQNLLVRQTWTLETRAEQVRGDDTFTAQITFTFTASLSIDYLLHKTSNWVRD